MSLESNIRSAVVVVVQGKWSELGFDDVNGNVHSFLLEHTEPEQWPALLSAQVSGSKTNRAWGVDVSRRRKPNATDQCSLDSIEVRIKGYYRQKRDALGRQAMTDGMGVVMEAMDEAGTTLGGLVTRTVDVTLPAYDELPLKNERFKEIWSIEAVWTMEKQV